MASLTAVEVSAGYRGRTVIHGIDLNFGPGVHIILGANGAGKTTTFRVLCGILRPHSGRVLIEGKEPHADIAAKALVGVAAHRAALAPRLSVADNVRYWGRILGLPPVAIERRLPHVLDVLGLTGLAGQRAGTLSRGQSQRVGLAKALIGDPPVLLLDEPMSGVDPGTAAHVRTHLRQLAEEGRTVVASTHSLADAAVLADDVAVLHRGRVIAQGAPAQLRAALLGKAYRLRLKGSGDLPGELKELGYTCEAERDGAAVVTVADETEAESLVARLVHAGVGLREVAPLGNPLEEVYQRLQDAGSPHDDGLPDKEGANHAG